MRICAAQTKPVKGDIPRNIDHHKTLIGLAAFKAADIVIFPELSLTGYEPTLANQLSIDKNDTLFDDFQQISDSKRITIGVGVPTQGRSGIHISMVLFQPNLERQTHSKHHLHSDEKPFFVSGRNLEPLTVGDTNIALAICYEIAVPEHSEDAFKRGATVYMASVAKFTDGIGQSMDRLSEIARKHSMTVLMSNCVGYCDGQRCAGKTSIWNNHGLLIGQLNDEDEGILMINTETQEIVAARI